MSDLVSREEAIRQAEEIIGASAGYKAFAVLDVLRNLPSAEPEVRTVKVIEHDASVTDTDGYKYLRTEYICGNCKKKVIGGDEYCSHCGAKLDWSGNE